MTHLAEQLAQPVTLWFLVDLQELKNQHYNMTATKHAQNILLFVNISFSFCTRW